MVSPVENVIIIFFAVIISHWESIAKPLLEEC